MDDTDKTLKQREFDPGARDPVACPIYTLGGIVVATAGNLVAIAGGIKVGKSGAVGAMCAAAMCADEKADLLGFGSQNPKGLAIVHCDTEQSPSDHRRNVRAMLKRAGQKERPAWFLSYCLTGLGHQKAWECAQRAMRRGFDRCGGLHSVFLDGAADLVKDVNDAAECNEFLARLQGLAMEYDCAIIAVIHFNPGSYKPRGHFGSELERRAESNLELVKRASVTEISSEKQRGAPILKGKGPCFIWSEKEGMHVTAPNRGATKAKAKAGQNRTRWAKDAAEVFARVKGPLRYKALVDAITGQFSIKPRAARERLKNWVKAGAVAQDKDGLYHRPTS